LRDVDVGRQEPLLHSSCCHSTVQAAWTELNKGPKVRNVEPRNLGKNLGASSAQMTNRGKIRNTSRACILFSLFSVDTRPKPKARGRYAIWPFPFWIIT
jgi:hypothetical protein